MNDAYRRPDVRYQVISNKNGLHFLDLIQLAIEPVV
jgi:hypothetical protein